MKGRTEEGSILKGEKIYYECRKPPKSQQKFNQDIGGIYYFGKLNGARAACISIQPLSDYALAGKVIGFKCNNKPPDPQLFRAREMHRGNYGYLGGQVFCRIFSHFQNISG